MAHRVLTAVVASVLTLVLGGSACRADFVVTGAATDLGGGLQRYDFQIREGSGAAFRPYSFVLQGAVLGDVSEPEGPSDSWYFYSTDTAASWGIDAFIPGVPAPAMEEGHFSFVSDAEITELSYRVTFQGRTPAQETGTVVIVHAKPVETPEPGALVLFGLGGLLLGLRRPLNARAGAARG